MLQTEEAENPTPTNAARSALTLVYVRCDEVIVEKRHRKHLPGIASLSESIGQIGVLQPIAITPGRLLIAGERRLTSAMQAGETVIPAIVHHRLQSQYELLLAEAMENTEREQPAPSDLADIAEDMLPLAQEAARLRLTHREDKEATLPKSFTEAGEALEHIARLLKLSRPTLTKIRKIVAAAREDPARFGDLQERMDGERKVDGAYNELLRRQGLLKEKPKEPDLLEGVRVRTDKQGNFNIQVNADHPATIARLKRMLKGWANEAEATPPTKPQSHRERHEMESLLLGESHP